MVLSALGEDEAALEVLRRVLQEKPAFEMTYVTLCRIYMQAGQPTDAIQALERLLQINPKNPQGLELLRQLRGGG
jgi:predicted Zn-dependent protease